MIRRIFVSLLATLCAVLSASAQDAKLRVGVLRLASSAPVFIALDRGYFAERKLAVELSFFDAAQPIALAVAAGDIDFGVTAFTGGLFNLAAKGGLKVVAGQSRDAPGYPLIAYLANPRAYEAALRRPQDTAGRRIGITQVGSSFHYSVGLLAEKYKFPLDKVELVPLQSMSNAAAALKGGRTDGALLPATVALPLINAGEAQLLGWVGDETPWQVGAVFGLPKVLADAGLVERFLEAYRAGTRDYHDQLLPAVKEGKASIPTALLIASIARHTQQSADTVLTGLPFVDRDGRLDVASVRDQIRWYRERGFADPGVTLENVVEGRFVR
ncbi:MAG: ABC transporter substrate-binding protein [Proteobacteria bacterium]|nr:MAG: ABC transporter substrate-binding protein [Pseudomonadota bacterium]